MHALRRVVPAVLVGVAMTTGCREDLPPALGAPIPDAEFIVVDAAGSTWSKGDRIRLSELEGKPVILDYWASWCFPCRKQHEYVSGLQAKYGDEVQILGILFEDTEPAGLAWLEEHGATYPTVKEVDGTIADEFWITGIPHFIMLAPDRTLSWDMRGSWAADSVTERLSEMLPARSGA